MSISGKTQKKTRLPQKTEITFLLELLIMAKAMGL